MKLSQATVIVTRLAAYWRVELGEETEGLWAEAVQAYEWDDAFEASTLLGESSVFMPSLADFTATIVELRNDRLREETPALPPAKEGDGVTFAQFLKGSDEYRERVLALDAKPTMRGNPVVAGLGALIAPGRMH